MKLALLLGAALVATASPAAAKIPWKRIKGASDLMANEQRLAGEIMSKARTYYGCKGTVSKCLGARGKASRNAWRLARYIVFLVGKGLSEKEVLKVVSLRRKSAKPKKRKRIKVAGTPYLGPLNAPVQIVEYADFRCGHCAAVAPMLKQLLAKYKGKVVLFFKPYPLRQGAAVRAAQASLAAHLQGKFWPMHKRLFDNPSMHDAAGLTKLAKAAGLDVGKFQAAMQSRALLKIIDKNKREGLKLGITGTPTLYFNGKKYRLRKDLMHLQERIEEELEMLGKI
ncbi:MAG: thioredoxin domain-containing protein [Myxococcales bacterium]|nr:thioredoxin domain-containing protein [Myxococcales bacterium]